MYPITLVEALKKQSPGYPLNCNTARVAQGIPGRILIDAGNRILYNHNTRGAKWSARRSAI